MHKKCSDGGAIDYPEIVSRRATHKSIATIYRNYVKEYMKCPTDILGIAKQ